MRGKICEQVIAGDVFVTCSAHRKQHKRANSRSVGAGGAVQIHGFGVGVCDKREYLLVFVGEFFKSCAFRSRRNGHGGIIDTVYIRSQALIGIAKVYLATDAQPQHFSFTLFGYSVQVCAAIV